MTKVVLAINSDLGKPGKIGMRTYHIAKVCLEKNALVKIFCRSAYAKDIPRRLYYVPFLQKTISLFIRAMNLRVLTPKKQVQSQNKVLGIFDFWVRRHMPPCDIFHTWEYLEKSLQKAKTQGIQTILDIQMAPVLYVDGKPTPYQKAAYLKYPELIDYFIAPSEFTKDILLQLHIPEEKIFLVPFGVDTAIFRPTETKKEKFICMFAGTLCERKGTRLLLQAWEELNLQDAELVLCGNIKKEFRGTLHTYKNRLKNLRTTGSISENKLMREYQQASIFVFPSLVEGSAKVTYEALACGLPVVTTKNAGSVVEDGVSGYIIPDMDVQSIKEKMRYLYDNPQETIRIGKNARLRAEQYTWKHYGENIMELYERIKTCTR